MVILGQQPIAKSDDRSVSMRCITPYMTLIAGTAESVEEALEIAAQIGRYPLIIRPAFTCGGAGGGIAYNVDEFKRMVAEGIDASMTNQV